MGIRLALLFHSQFTFSRDDSTAVSNLLRTTTARSRHGSHSAQTTLYIDDILEVIKTYTTPEDGSYPYVATKMRNTCDRRRR